MPRTINDIIPPSRRRAMNDALPPAPPEAPETYSPPPAAPRPPMYTSRPRRRFPWVTAVVALVVVIGSIGILELFSGARVDITPTTNTGTITGTFTATPSTGTLPFALVNVQKTATESVPAESTVTANDAAQGSITIYNTQAKAQQLIANTRFETSAGLIFRIHQSVSVPAGSAVSPGTLVATAYADSPGDTYNIGPSSFTLPGLAGSPQASQVYAKSTTPMTGGFSGTRPAVGQATDDAEHTKLQATLASQMAAEVTPKIPDGYILVPGSIFTTYAPLTDAADANGGVAVKEQATAVAVVFPADALVKTLASQVIGQNYTGDQALMLKDVSTLTLKTASSTTPSAASPFTFALSGNVTIVWKVDQTKIASAIAGKSRAAAKSIISEFPEVHSASLLLRPFWRSAFPTDPASITVNVATP